MTETQTPDGAKPASLASVVTQLKNWVERLGQIWIEADVIQLKRRQQVTQFLTIRDPYEEVSATLTCSKFVLDKAGPVMENSRIYALVHPQVWKKTTNLAFSCTEIKIAGEGLLLADLERLKMKLHAEGLFDDSHKKPLPILPNRIGVITGAKSAAEQDVITNIRSKWPNAPITVMHSLVQGVNAVPEVIRCLAYLDANPDIDVIIIARGGGSLEDLLPFSNEGLVRAVFAAKTPVVSAIGHEPDTPILDLVADYRAATPTAAGKAVVPNKAEEMQIIDTNRVRLRNAWERRFAAERELINHLKARPVLQSPERTIQAHRDTLNQVHERMNASAKAKLQLVRADLRTLTSQLRAMSPEATLGRGYCVVFRDDQPITSIDALKPGDALTTVLADGRVLSTVDTTSPTPGLNL